ncbi:MAG: hypothetical protein ABUT39_08685 [Acidobacteriota bacterium]
MRNRQSLSFLALLLLPAVTTAAHALTPVGAPLAIVDGAPCSVIADLEVISTPKGAVEVVWVDGPGFDVKGQRFGRDLVATDAPVSLLPLHGGLNVVHPVGTWTGRYELALNVLDFGEDPADPKAAYRLSLDLDGNPVGEPARFETKNFLQIAPAGGGDALQLRVEPPYYGRASCRSRGILASRIDPGGSPISVESRLTKRASGWAGADLEVARQPNDTFVAAYATCDQFVGVVARRLNATGAPVGKPINLPFPGRVADYYGSGGLALAAKGNDLAVAAMALSPPAGPTAGYTRAVVNGKILGVNRIPTPAGFAGVSGVVDLEPSPTGSGYLLLFQAAGSDRFKLFAQALDAQGVPQGVPVALTEDGERGLTGAIASLPDGRWLVVIRSQSGLSDACTESLVGTVLGE